MKCKFIKAEGNGCQANCIIDSNYCFMHDPTKAEERAIAVKKGGLASKKLLLTYKEEIKLDDFNDAKSFLAKLINAVWIGEIPATPIANTLGFLIRCFIDAHEKAEVERRLDEIEKVLRNANQ